MIGGSKSGKINTLINLINEQNNIDNIYLYAKDLSENETLIKQHKNARIKHYNGSTLYSCLNVKELLARSRRES